MAFPRDKRVLPAILLVALCLRLVSLLTFNFIDSGGGSDTVTYLVLAENLFSGAGYTEFGLPHTVHHPFYPILIGSFHLLGPDLLASARLISFFSSVLLVIPVFFLGLSMFGAGSGLAAGLLAALFPPLLYGATEPFTEPLYTFLLLAALWAAWASGRRGSPAASAFSGVLFALAFLTHPMGAVFLPLFTAFVFLRGLWEKRAFLPLLGRTLALPGAFSLVCLPFWLYLHSATGRWQLSGSSHYQDFGLRYEQGRGVPESRVIFEHMEELFHPEDVRLAEPGRVPLGMGELILKHPARFGRIVLFNLEDAWGEALKSARYLGIPPVFLPVLLAAGALFPAACLVFALVRRRSRSSVIFLLLALLPMGVFLVLQVEHRYFYPFIPVALILLSWPLGRLGEHLVLSGRARTALALSVILFGSFLAGSVYLAWRKANYLGVPYEYRLLGDWMRENIEGIEEERVMMFRLGVSYYAGCEWNVFYWGDYPGLLEYMRRRDLNYLVIDAYKIHMIHPELRRLLAGDPPPEFELVKEVSFSGRPARLLRLRSPQPPTTD